MDPLRSHLEATGLTVSEARHRLAGVRVGVIGPEWPGAHASAILARCGVEVSGLAAVTRERVHALVRDCRLLVSCLDKGFAAAHHWLNSASLRWGVPAVYAQLDGDTALVGPLVVPARTACYLCWRMRTVACAEDFGEAMAQEEALATRRLPALIGQAVPRARRERGRTGSSRCPHAHRAETRIPSGRSRALPSWPFPRRRRAIACGLPLRSSAGCVVWSPRSRTSG